MLQLGPLRLMCLLEYFLYSPKGGLKGKLWIWTKEKAYTA
jgi:hypothetical protein